jgi:hypothetical protein
MKVCYLLAAVAGCAWVVPAFAQSSQIYNEFSTDNGATWAMNASAEPGTTVHVRVRVALVGATSLGLAGLTMQPVLQGWRPDLGDTVVPFTFPGLNMTSTLPSYGTPTTETAYTGRNVENVGTNTGRMFPFGSAGQSATSTSGLLTSFNDPGNVLRFAGSKNTTAATNLSWGVGIAQLPQTLAVPNYYAGAFFNPSLDVVVFRYAITLAEDTTPRDLLATIPAGLISGNKAAWYTQANGAAATNLETIVNDSSIFVGGLSIIPAPGASGLALVGIAMLARRRR